MAVRKVYYNGKCVMTVDMDYVEEDSMFEYLNEVFGVFQERAYKEFGVESTYESEARKVWTGNEYIYELMNEVEQKLEHEMEVDSLEKGFEKVEKLYCIMQEKLNADEYELFKKLRSEESRCFNNLENKFFAGEGCLDYVWIERNGQKEYFF